MEKHDKPGPVIVKAVQGRLRWEGFVEKVGFEPGVTDDGC